MAKFTSLPQHIAVYIVTLLAKSGFQFLGPLIASGHYGMLLAFDEAVLKEASLRIIEDNPAVVNRRTIFRPFFERTIFARNPVADYLEGIHYVARYGDYASGIPALAYPWSSLFGRCHPSSSKSFTLSLLMLSVHEMYEAIELMTQFQSAFSNESEVDLMAQRVFNDIIVIAGPRRRRLARLQRKIPTVTHFCNECLCGNKCAECYTWWRAQKFKNLFLAP